MTAVEQKWVFRSLHCTLCQFTCLCATYRLHRREEKKSGEQGRGGERSHCSGRRGEKAAEKERLFIQNPFFLPDSIQYQLILRIFRCLTLCTGGVSPLLRGDHWRGAKIGMKLLILPVLLCNRYRLGEQEEIEKEKERIHWRPWVLARTNLWFGCKLGFKGKDGTHASPWPEDERVPSLGRTSDGPSCLEGQYDWQQTGWAAPSPSLGGEERERGGGEKNRLHDYKLTWKGGDAGGIYKTKLITRIIQYNPQNMEKAWLAVELLTLTSLIPGEQGEAAPQFSPLRLITKPICLQSSVNLALEKSFTPAQLLQAPLAASDAPGAFNSLSAAYMCDLLTHELDHCLRLSGRALIVLNPDLAPKKNTTNQDNKV
ncbi:hypothetical protein INR49_026638 [Caranx melampygus]|nr:hypothetical protein INR49_026638 [Caranx melampygus]